MNLINNKEWISKSRIVAGVMTGTSLDSVDIAVVRFSLISGKEEFEILLFDEYEIPYQIKELVRLIIESDIRISDVSKSHFELAHLYDKGIREVCRKHKFDIKLINAVGIHGQTVRHDPPNSEMGKTASTLQLGSGPVFAKLLGIPVVHDFRSADLALGGQAAPLVPIFDCSFLSSKQENIIALNIGGMANLTYLPKSCTKDQVIAFDTGPGNILIDTAVKLFYGKDYDLNGNTALSGKINNKFLNELKQDKFITMSPPKSTGRETYNKDYLHDMTKNKQYSESEIIATLSYFTAWSIAENIRLFADDNSTLIISGGGVKNKAILNGLQLELPNTKIASSDEFGIPYNTKEAICFAYLAWLNLAGKPGNIKSVTGASEETILGSLSI